MVEPSQREEMWERAQGENRRLPTQTQDLSNERSGVYWHNGLAPDLAENRNGSAYAFRHFPIYWASPDGVSSPRRIRLRESVNRAPFLFRLNYEFWNLSLTAP